MWPRHALRLTGDRARAEDVVQETLLRAWQHPEVADDSERTGTGLAFHACLHMIIDERRSSRFRKEVPPVRRLGRPRARQPHEVNAALDRLLIGDAVAQLPADHRAAIRRSYYLGGRPRRSPRISRLPKAP